MTAPRFDRRAELRDFLRRRRAVLQPSDVGLPDVGRRRTPGLRREEVAQLAGVGVSWYTWLEQGRPINVSDAVLGAIARALRLGRTEREHLYLLAGSSPPPADGAPAPPSAQLERLLHAWAPRPAYVLDRYWNLVAVNGPAREVFGYDEHDHNCLVTFFTNRRYRDREADWDAAAPRVVARFRTQSARHPDDPRYARIADELAAASPRFRELWARHEVEDGAELIKAVTHPELGDLTFESTALSLDDRPGDHLVLHNPAEGTDTLAKLSRLGAARVGTPA